MPKPRYRLRATMISRTMLFVQAISMLHFLVAGWIIPITTKPDVKMRSSRTGPIFSIAIPEPVALAVPDLPSLSIDPLITTILDEESASSVQVGGILAATEGIKTWRISLIKGRLPTPGIDFNSTKIWPQEPLFSKLSDMMLSMELPRFAYRHPEVINSVVISLIRLIVNFSEEMKSQLEYKEDLDDGFFDEDYDHDEEDEWYSWDYDDTLDNLEDETLTIDLDDDTGIVLSEQEINDIAETALKSFAEEWGSVVTGTTLLDQLFGPDHELLDINQNGVGVNGFGLEDGIWKHTGWNEIPELQKHISTMHELRDLLKEIGRRPTAEQSDRIHKFAPRKLQQDGALGAQFDPQRRESVDGITLSGSLSEMLPSEAVLLRGSFPSLRRLFLAKKAESKLLSYQLSGWVDVPSVPLTRPLYSKRMPSAPGGPIVVCLDTSWSMSGKREVLSKSVVLACVSAAHKQRRECQVVAFSTERGVMEAGVITAGSAGIKRLLDFLGHSFGGGTDVTGALKFAMASLDSDIMAAADILMITDGEIPDPPVSNEVMEKLDVLKFRKGVEVHGLLVGKRASKPLSRLCTTTYDFLSDYDFFANPLMDTRGTSTLLRCQGGRLSLQLNKSRNSSFLPRGAWGASRETRGRPSLLALRAKRSSDEVAASTKRRKKKGSNPDVDDEYSYMPVGTSSNSFSEEVEKITSQIKDAVKKETDSSAWLPDNIETERSSEESCWKFRQELKAAIYRVGEGLVEREEEARLVVLAMLSNEHILFLGVPGTGKSVLGRRLSMLCDGTFFQRLLTRFTTPEELFGPLSLRSLENDEYRRCTSGFLPTASVAFLDEIFKANSAILNTLLTILNERKFDNSGGQEPCPVRCVVGASNELPESDELVALFDRFLIRKEVHPVSDDGVLTMLALSNPGYSACDSTNPEGDCDVFTDGLDKIVDALSYAADEVHIESDVSELIRDLRIFMKSEVQAEISDRRLVKAARLLKICAAADGRTRVDPVDCLLLQHCMWQLPEQRGQLREWLLDNITPGSSSGASGASQFRLLLDGLRDEAVSLVRKTSGDVSGEAGGREEDVRAIRLLREEVARVGTLLCQRRDDLLRHMELLEQLDGSLWLHPDEIRSIQQSLSPTAKAVAADTTQILVDARALEWCLSDNEILGNEYRLPTIESLWAKGLASEVSFTDDELSIGMKEAKAKYDLDTFRKWKRARKRAQKT